MKEKEKQLPTKEWLLDQMKKAELIAYKNDGIFQFCKAMLEQGIYIKNGDSPKEGDTHG